MTAPVLLETLIEKALIDRVSAWTGFYPVTYPSNVPTLGTPGIAPTAVEAGPSKSTFDIESVNKMSRQNARITWTWVVTAQWPTKVALGGFEDDVNQKPIVIKRDEANGIFQEAEIRFKEARYAHPVRGEPPLGAQMLANFTPGLVGTAVLWTFSVSLTPYPSGG